MTRYEMKPHEMADKISRVIDRVALATMAVDGWSHCGERPEGVNGLGNLLDEAIYELRQIKEIIHPDSPKVSEVAAA